MIAGRVSIPNFEGVQRHAGPEQMRPKLKLVGFSGAVYQRHRFKPGIVKVAESLSVSDLRI
jgi:hypothetical protein